MDARQRAEEMWPTRKYNFIDSIVLRTPEFTEVARDVFVAGAEWATNPHNATATDIVTNAISDWAKSVDDNELKAIRWGDKKLAQIVFIALNRAIKGEA